MPRPSTVLCLNGGSSSLKFAIYQIDKGSEVRLAEGAAEEVGLPSARFWMRDSQGRMVADTSAGLHGTSEVVTLLLGALSRNGSAQFSAAGHRIVHGGPDYTSPQLVTPSLMLALKRFIPFAPQHLPAQLELVDAIGNAYPKLPQVVCFDTAVHRSMPELAGRFPLPRRLWDEGIRRYGFHGLSYEFILASLGSAAGRRTIIAHLGNGASMVAVLDGVPIDTTMGFTPSGGMMMSTRSGDLDPGILVYLLQQKRYDAGTIQRLVNDESGLLGVSASTSDMKTLLENRPTQPEAAQAVAMFCYQARKWIGALSAVLGGLDMLVFTGGIGEHAAPVRYEICTGLEYLGVHISEEQNSRNAPVISIPASPCTFRVILTNEDLIIERRTRCVLER